MSTTDSREPFELSPSKDGGIIVDVHRGSGDHDYRVTSAASLKSVFRYIGEADFVLLTNYRMESHVLGERVVRTRSDNARDFLSMVLGLPAAGRKGRSLSFWLVAHWTCETAGVTTLEDSHPRIQHFVEYSCLMKFEDPAFREDVLSRAVSIASSSDQEGFITRFGGAAVLRNAQGQVKRALASAREVEAAWKTMSIRRSLRSEMRTPLGELHLHAPDDHGCKEGLDRSCYNVSGPQESTPFRFYLARPDNNSGRMMFSHLGLWAHVEP